VNTPSSTDLRFGVPLYTLTEAAKYLVVPRATLATWADGYERRPAKWSVVKGEPIITAFPQDRQGYARLPFIGIAEAYVLNAFRRAGLPMQRIRPSINWLVKNVGPHALASEDLFTDGAEVLWRFAQESGEGSPDDEVVRGLVVPRSGQIVFKEIVEHYLKQITFDDDKFAAAIRLPQYGEADVVLDPHRGFGQPVFSRSGVRVSDVLGPLQAGATFQEVAEDYGVTESELVDALDAIAA